MRYRQKLAFSFLFLVIILIGIFLTVVFSRQKQQARQHAAGANGDVVVDFGNRQNTANPISSTFLGIGGLGLNNVMAAVPPFIAQANLRLSRIDASFETVFPTAASATDSTQQNWSKLDPALTFFQQNHMTPILILDFTPTWLQPANNPCASLGKPLSHVNPTDPQMWGKLAANTVAHIDKNFPKLHPLYEFWNEPDGTGFWCEPTTGADAQRLSEFKHLWAVSGPQMRQQAQQDGVTIKMGGPALDYITQRYSTWTPAIVNDPTVAPYIDFFSYHQYAHNQGTWVNLVNITQDPNTGYISLYQQISSFVHAGKQPNAAQTPIYIGEYNGSACANGACRSDPTYSPLWNSLFLVDQLNTVLTPIASVGVAKSIPAGLSYFTWSEPQGNFCMFGVLDANLDCSINGTIQPYPQYYAYQLFGGTNYLNITDNGYVANAVKSNISGVYATGFYTNKSDDVVIVNTNSTPYSNLMVSVQNPGTITNSTVTMFTLNQANPQIGKSQTTFQQSGTGYTMFVNVPALSTIALSIDANAAGSTVTPSPSPTAIPSPTPTPTETSTPSPTFPPGSTVFNVTVCPHGLGNCGDNASPSGGNTKPYHTTRNAKLFIYDSNNNLVDTRQMVVQYDPTNQNFQGTIASKILSSGIYTVAIKMDGFLTRRIPGIVTINKGQTITLPLVSPVSGDINNDNQIDAADYGIIVSCFGSKASTPSCPEQYKPGVNNVSAGADILDDDLQVDGADYNEFIRELSTQLGG